MRNSTLISTNVNTTSRRIESTETNTQAGNKVRSQVSNLSQLVRESVKRGENVVRGERTNGNTTQTRRVENVVRGRQNNESTTQTRQVEQVTREYVNQSNVVRSDRKPRVEVTTAAQPRSRSMFKKRINLSSYRSKNASDMKTSSSMKTSILVSSNVYGQSAPIEREKFTSGFNQMADSLVKTGYQIVEEEEEENENENRTENVAVERRVTTERTEVGTVTETVVRRESHAERPVTRRKIKLSEYRSNTQLD